VYVLLYSKWKNTDNKIRAAMVLTKAREAAEKAAANQALFLANMSHEVPQKR
jgi:hypothetical protein